MLSAPIKSARRISSMLNLGSNKDNPTTAAADSQRLSPNLAPQAHRRVRSTSAHHNPPPGTHSPGTRPTTSYGLDVTPVDSSAPLPPPPSLLDINQTLLEPSNLAPTNQRRSASQPRSNSRPSSIRNSFISLSPPALFSSSPRPESVSDDPRRSFLQKKSPTGSVDDGTMGLSAWIAGLEHKIPYDLGPLTRGEQIPELWNEFGDTFVYLFPQNTGRSPSFKVDSSIFTDSPSLTFLARGQDARVDALRRGTRYMSLTERDMVANSDGQLADNDNGSSGTGRMTMVDDIAEDSQPLHLYLPIPLHGDVSDPKKPLLGEDTESLVLYRNLFAFLLGQALVATPQSRSLFRVFMEVADLLRRFEFSNLDGSSFGETVTSSFANYCEELQLLDVRKSREKTIEAIVLGESLRFYPLYLEGFVHGVGKLDDIKQIGSVKYDSISPITLQRLERGYIDLENRLKTIHLKLSDFDFPSLWSGIANSNTAAETKVVHFKAWKAAFLNFRRFTVSHYRQKYGAWPPRAKSKRNNFEGDGLNRLVLRELYNDFTDLYDMLVDRMLLTTRTTDMASDDLDSPDPVESMIRALRRMESEYDRSTPPVQPPIPFDIPQFPSFVSRRAIDSNKDFKERQRKLKDSEINEILMGSYTREALRPTEFIESFMQFERRDAHGKSLDEIINNRCGQWLFLYAVLQSLPLLVVDVSDIQWTDRAEYFLCIAPRGGAPWVQNDPKTGRSWFGVAGGSGVVSLPSDVVTHGVEGVFRRSHCWQVATQWAEKSQFHVAGSPSTDDTGSIFSSPTPANHSSIGSTSDIHPASPMLNVGRGMSPVMLPRTGSPNISGYTGTGSGSYPHRGSIHPGLEALPLPVGVMPVDPPTKPTVRHNPNMSFDDILREIPKRKK